MTVWVDAAGEAGEAGNLNDLETRIKAALPAFSQHTWTQKTSSSPLSAANLNALENWGGIVVNLKDDVAADFNQSTGIGTDNTSAINSAIASIKGTAGTPRGGIIVLPTGSGKIKVTDTLDASDTGNITLLGSTLNSANEPATTGSAPTCIHYTGTTATRLIDARSTNAFHMQGIAVTHDAAWSGKMVDFDHSATGGDSQHARLTNCAFAGYLQNTCTLVSLRAAIFARIDNCYFGRSAYAIRLREDSGGAIVYSNSHVIRDCQFARCNEGIVNAGDGLLIEGCGFEGTGGNIQHAYLDDLVNVGTNGNVTWINNWFGDSFSAVPDYWIDTGKTNVRSWVFLGNMFNQERVLKIGTGGFRNLTIIGNAMGQTGDHCMDLGASISRGLVVIGNSLSAGTGVDTIANRAQHRQKLIAGNFNTQSNGSEGFDEITMVSGHVHEESGTPPTASTIHANAGSGASVSFSSNSTDRAGTFTLTTGTGAGAGVTNLVVFTAQHTFDSGIPRATITPANNAAMNLGGWGNGINSVATWSLALGSTKTLADTTAYQFNYQVA